MLTSSKRGLESQLGEELGGKATIMSKVLLHSDRHGRIRCTLIGYSKVTAMQTLGFGHENSGLSESNPASTYDKISWRAQAVTRVLARRPITLVLMMINSCSYSTNDLVFN